MRAATGIIRSRRDAALAVAATLVRALGSLIVQKMVAFGFGPGGVALLSHFQNLIGILTALPSDGLNRAMVVQAGPRPGHEKARVYGFGLLAVLAFALAVALASPWLAAVSPELFAGGGAGRFPLAVALGAGAFMVLAWEMAVLQSLGRLRRALAVQAAATVAGIGFLAAMGLDWSLVPLLSGWVIGQCVAGAVFLPWRAIRLNVQPPPGFLKAIGHFAVLAVGVALAGRTADFAVREFALGRYLRPEVGLWQAAVRLADVAFIPFQAIAGGVLFPKAAGLAQNGLGAFGRKYLGLALAFLVPAQIGLAVLSPLLIPLFNSRAFADASAYYSFIAPGEVARGAGLIPVYLLMARGKTYSVLMLELISLATYVGSVLVLEPRFGLAGIAVAGSIRSGVWAMAAAMTEFREAKRTPAL